MSNTPHTYLEIDLAALSNNYCYLKSLLEEKTRFLAVVKAYGYGSCESAIAHHLQGLGVDYFGVAFTHEGVHLRKSGIEKPILIFHPTLDDLLEVIKYQLEPALYSTNILEAFIAQTRGLEHEFLVHLKFNTGLNRLGFSEQDIPLIAQQIKGEQLSIAGVYSHLIASEDLSERTLTHSQIKKYERILKVLDDSGIKGFKRHLLNTSGILNYKEAQYDMVRSGIGIYGFGNDIGHDQHLTPIASLITSISQIHKLEKGDGIGYNRGIITDKPMVIATLPIGHADGINRIYGNGKGFVYVKDTKCAIIGNVCMDMIMIDITAIGDACKVGDQVVVFDKKYAAALLANATHTISYELITSIGKRIPRVIKNG